MGVQDILDLREEVGDNKTYAFRIDTEDGEYRAELAAIDYLSAIKQVEFDFKNQYPKLGEFNIVYMIECDYFIDKGVRLIDFVT